MRSALGAGRVDPGAELAIHLRGMVGFSNIAVHRYHDLSLKILRAILDTRMPDLLQFAGLVAKLAPP